MRDVTVIVLAALIAVFPVIVHPMLPRDSPAHVFGPRYAWEILTGRASPDLCHYWYMGFPYTTFYCFLPYYLAAPLTALLGPLYTFVVELSIAAVLFISSVYLLAKSVGFDRDRAIAASVLAASGMLPQWEWGGTYPMTLSFGFGLLALAMRDSRILAPILLALSLYSHPLGGTFSSLVMLLWGAFERRPGYAVSVGVAWALALPHYAFFLPYARWLSTLVDSPAPDELFRMLLLPFPDLVSPGAFLLALAGLGLWRARREPWARVAGVCWALTWGVVAAYALGLTQHLPLGRNLLLDRFTCVLITPLLALPAAYTLRDRARHVRIASKVLLVLSISSAALPLSGSLSCELPTVPGSADVVAWVKEHRSHDPIVRVEFLLATKRYGKPHNALWVGPRVKGFFAQGDPYFHALTERMEWEGFWWYDPEFVRTVCRLCNIEYLVVSSFPTVKSGMAAGLTPVYKSKWIRVLENRRIAGAEAVDPIGVYDPRSVREVVKEYTTALNLVPKRGYRYIFAVVEDPRELHAFRKVLIRPESPEDVRLAVRLAREGKRVLLVLPAGNDRIAREVSRELGVHPKPAELRLRPRYPRPILPRSLRTTLILKGLKRSEKVPPGYQVGGGWFRDVRVGRGTVRVVGVDLPVVAIRLHPTYVNVGEDLGKIPPLPGPHERRLYSRILDGFGSGLHPIPCRFDPRSARVEVIPSGYQWALVKVKHFPAWHARGGRILVGPGGTMIVRTHSERVTLYFAYPTRLYALGAVGFALGALALALRARPDAVLSVVPGQRPESD